MQAGSGGLLCECCGTVRRSCVGPAGLHARSEPCPSCSPLPPLPHPVSRAVGYDIGVTGGVIGMSPFQQKFFPGEGANWGVWGVVRPCGSTRSIAHLVPGRSPQMCTSGARTRPLRAAPTALTMISSCSECVDVELPCIWQQSCRLPHCPLPLYRRPTRRLSNTTFPTLPTSLLQAVHFLPLPGRHVHVHLRCRHHPQGRPQGEIRPLGHMATCCRSCATLPHPPHPTLSPPLLTVQ